MEETQPKRIQNGRRSRNKTNRKNKNIFFLLFSRFTVCTFANHFVSRQIPCSACMHEASARARNPANTHATSLANVSCTIFYICHFLRVLFDIRNSTLHLRSIRIQNFMQSLDEPTQFQFVIAPPATIQLEFSIVRKFKLQCDFPLEFWVVCARKVSSQANSRFAYMYVSLTPSLSSC